VAVIARRIPMGRAGDRGGRAAPGRGPRPERAAAFAGARLAGFKKPRRIEFVAALPRNAANKVRRISSGSKFTG